MWIRRRLYLGIKTGRVRGRTDVMEGDEGVFVLSSWHETYELMSWNHHNIRCKYIKEAKAINLWEIRCDLIVNNWIVVRTILSVCHEQHGQRLSSAASLPVFSHVSQNIFRRGNTEPSYWDVVECLLGLLFPHLNKILIFKMTQPLE